MSKQNRNEHRRMDHEEFQAYGVYGYDYTHGQPKADSSADQPSGRTKPVRRARRSGSAFFGFFLILTIATVGLVVMMQTVFRLEAVCVIGHQQHSAQEVINTSGLQYGQNIFSINAAEVRTALERDASLVFQGIQVKYPNMVYIQVAERKPVAVLLWLGIYYALDEDGIVLEDIRETEYTGNLPVITGMRVTSAHKGQRLEVNSSVQLSAYCALIDELTKQDYISQVKEIRLGKPENIYLVNGEGISIRIGQPEDLKRKVQAIRTAMGSLRSLNVRSGVMDVSDPTDVKFRNEE